MQHEPGMGAALADPAVGDGVLAEVQARLVLIQRAQLVIRFECSVIVGGLGPRDVLRGRDVATALGALSLLAPKATLVALGVFVAVVVAFRYVSLGSIVAVALFPLLAWLLRDYADAPPILGVMAIISVLIVAKHRQNIRRLLAGTEPRFRWKRG